MAINIRINVAVVAAVIVAELASRLWQSDALPWGRYEERFLISALCSDLALAVILQWITSTHWGVRKWEDALWLSVCVTLVYAALSAPQTVWGPKSLIQLCFVSLHKFVIVFAMVATMFLVRKYS
jgi:hypothetical protein